MPRLSTLRLSLFFALLMVSACGGKPPLPTCPAGEAPHESLGCLLLCKSTTDCPDNKECVNQFCRSSECGDDLCLNAQGKCGPCEDPATPAGEPECGSSQSGEEFGFCAIEEICNEQNKCVEDPAPEVCGNGSLDSALGEGCDDGNTENDDGCSSSCQTETGCACIPGVGCECHNINCGNGEVDTQVNPGSLDVQQEQCDGNLPSAGRECVWSRAESSCDICNAQCQIESSTAPYCGDGRTDGPGGNGQVSGEEECDDGNDDDTDECSSTCKKVFTEPPPVTCGEEEISDCRGDCNLQEFIGDDHCDEAFNCDDHDNDGGDCTEQGAICGNDTIEGVEECDDGDKSPGDGCDDSCKVEDGWICPLGGCVAKECGDGIVAGTEQCDAGSGKSDEPDSACSSTCLLPNCGDANLNAAVGEECDDGNEVDGDGCSRQCEIEDEEPVETDCMGTPGGSYWESDCGCVPANNSGDDCDDCADEPDGGALLKTYYYDADGDGQGDPNVSVEACDVDPLPNYVLNNDDPGDNCSSNMWDCEGTCDGSVEDDDDDGECNKYSSEEINFCGNGILEAGEQCDDGDPMNLSQNDRCTSDCFIVCDDDSHCGALNGHSAEAVGACFESEKYELGDEKFCAYAFNYEAEGDNVDHDGGDDIEGFDEDPNLVDGDTVAGETYYSRNPAWLATYYELNIPNVNLKFTPMQTIQKVKSNRRTGAWEGSPHTYAQAKFRLIETPWNDLCDNWNGGALRLEFVDQYDRVQAERYFTTDDCDDFDPFNNKNFIDVTFDLYIADMPSGPMDVRLRVVDTNPPNYAGRANIDGLVVLDKITVYSTTVQ